MDTNALVVEVFSRREGRGSVVTVMLLRRAVKSRK